MATEPIAAYQDLETANQAVLEQKAEIETLQQYYKLEQEKCAALEAEVERLHNQVIDLHEEAKALGAQLEKALKQKPAKGTASSVVIETAPPAPDAPLERPVVDIDGTKYQFARGRMNIFGRTALATELAADESLCLRILQEYPQLLQPV